MKTKIHKAEDRGFANHGWLQANHSFSFANYFNPDNMNFGVLRVLNDDIIAPKMGFGTHPHDNMEIITIPLSGSLKHRDSLQNEWQTIEAGEVQIMSAGSGLQHSEMNGSNENYLSLFQIWIMPNKQNIEPRYGQKRFDPTDRINKLQTLVTSIDEDYDGSLKIHQDAVISRIDLDKKKIFTYKLKTKNHGVYMMMISGLAKIDSKNLESRDAISIMETDSFDIQTLEESQILFIEVPMI